MNKDQDTIQKAATRCLQAGYDLSTIETAGQLFQIPAFLTALRCVAIDQFRTSSRQSHHETKLKYLRPERFAPSPLDELINKERIGQLKSLINQLPERERVAIQAIYIEGREIDELCIQLGESTSSLNSLLHRARTRMRFRARAVGWTS